MSLFPSLMDTASWAPGRRSCARVRDSAQTRAQDHSRHVQSFVAHTMALANAGSTEEVLAAFFYGCEDVIPEMFRRLLDTIYGARHNSDRLRHFIYYIDRHIELDGDSHGPMGRELLANLIANAPQAQERAVRAACLSIRARIELWNGLLSKLRSSRGVVEGLIERELPDDQWAKAGMVGRA